MENYATTETDMDTFIMDPGSEEYQLLMAYCSRRKRLRSSCPRLVVQKSGFHVSDAVHMGQAVYKGGGIIPQGPLNSRPMLSAISNNFWKFPEEVDVKAPKGAEGYSLIKVADKLTEITDSVKITTDKTILHGGHLEADGPVDQDYVIQRIVELLKASGDKLDEDIKRNPTLLKLFQTSFTYGLFEKVTTTLLQSVMGEKPGAQYGCLDPGEDVERVQREKIALACEVTNRLSALDLHPMNRAMGFGAHYLQQHHTAWVKKHGGWSKAFDSEDTD